MNGEATAVAHPNIALAKYWGKRAQGVNLPSVPSLSLTLAGMSTTTTVRFDPGAAADELRLDGASVSGRPVQRVTALVDGLWQRSSVLGSIEERPRVIVDSQNDFPTASGLASSASAFAALAVAANAAAGAELDVPTLSDLSRTISASSARSFFGGYVQLLAGDDARDWLPAEQVASPEHWPLSLVVAVTQEGQKKVGSTQGMIRTAETSPYYPSWVEKAPALYERVKEAVLCRDFEALVAPVEQSAMAMHATSLAADPAIVYWNGATLRAIECVRHLRAEGLDACFTIDAGPHVKVLTRPECCVAVQQALEACDGVLRTIVAEPGGGPRLVQDAP